MVYVIQNNSASLQVIMDDKTGGGGEEKRNDPDFLPSLGLGAYLSTSDAASKLMEQIRKSDGSGLQLPALKKQPGKVVSNGSVGSTRNISNGTVGSTRNVRSTNTQQRTATYELQPGTSRDYKTGYQQPASGNTTPLTSTTINMEDISDDYDSKAAIFSAVTQIPELSVRAADYTRFRYASERKKGKTRQYEMDEDKRFLADVKVTKYIGPATVIMHCVDSQGQLHPYHLDGEDCSDGVFYKRFDFSPRSSTLRITKTIVIQPKATEYTKSLTDQQNFLRQTKALDGTEKSCGTPQDKQCVHFHVKVYLDNGNEGTYLNTITSAIRNKKDGTEFKIHAITPCSARANGTILPHIGPKVYIMVTNETAFPKDVDVVFRNKDIGWEVVLNKERIKKIKKAVVELVPPPYADENITENVEVDVCLRDRTTGKETEPASFLYIGDQYGIHSKNRKRKREDMEEFPRGPPFPEIAVQAQRKMLHSLRTHGTESPVSDKSSSSGDDTPHDSIEFTQEVTIVTEDQSGHIANVQPTTNDVSLEGRRANRTASTQQQQATTTLSMHPQPGSSYMTQIGGVQGLQYPSSEIVTSAESVYSSSVTQSTSGQASGPGVNIYLQTQQQPGTSQEGKTFNPSILENMSPDMLMRLAGQVQNKQITIIPEFERMMWEKVAEVFKPSEENTTPFENPQQTAQVQNTPVVQPETVPQVQSLTDLPTLPPDCHYAIIKGQIMVVRNDIQPTQGPFPSGSNHPVNVADHNNVTQPINELPSDLHIPSDCLRSDYFNQFLAQSEQMNLMTNEVVITTTPSTSQPRQPPPEFWRAITGTTSNLDDDDDVEIDFCTTSDKSDVVQKSISTSSALGDKKPDGTESSIGGENRKMDVDDENENEADKASKVHRMKTRGKKINYKNALREYEDALSDIKDSGDDMVDEGEKATDNDDEMGKYLTPKKKYTKGIEKRNTRRGKALYEGDNYDDDDEEEEDNRKTSPSKAGKTSRSYGKGKDIKLVKKIVMADSEEDSQGFECNADS